MLWPGETHEIRAQTQVKSFDCGKRLIKLLTQIGVLLVSTKIRFLGSAFPFMHITTNPKPNANDIIPLLLNWVYVTREGQSEV